MIKAVIFDFDGTLVDSEQLHIDVLRKAIKTKVNVDIKPEEIGKLAGMTYLDKIRILLKDIEYDENEVLKQAREYFFNSFKSKMKLQKGVKKVLKTISKMNFKIGLYSPNPKYVLEETLKKFGIRGYFQTIVAVEDVTRPKPHPEGYLLAAERLNVKPEECLVFEDTPTGYQSAKSAGMKVTVLDNPYLKNPSYPQADFFVKNFELVNEDFFSKL